jgi:sulfate adenylyltransferase
MPASCRPYKSLSLACDLVIATGAFSPLDRFMGREDYHRVLEEMRLSSEPFFPIPVTLPVEAIPDLHLDRDIALRNNEYELLAVLTVDEIYQWDRFEFADKVYGMHDLHQPAVFELSVGVPLNISGRYRQFTYQVILTSRSCTTRRSRCEPG